MNISQKNNIRSENAFERLINENGLGIIDLKIYQEQDSMIVILNNGNAIKVKLSEFPILKKTSPNTRSKWKIIFNGKGIEWKSLNFDISLKNLLEENAVYSALQKLQSPFPVEFV